MKSWLFTLFLGFPSSVDCPEGKRDGVSAILAVIVEVLGTYRLSAYFVTKLAVEFHGLTRPLFVRSEAPFPSLGHESGIRQKLSISEKSIRRTCEQSFYFDDLRHG
jgi:hypothetical protein